ncbi:MAG TPA: hypothetical protein VM142_13535 [Acidimicrobiales bacterium]|nr:hypothetical protein [Acidimicrobiales bacterium]
MALRRVLLDTNACFPISLLDLMLRLDEAAFHEVIWAEDLLGELVEVWVKKGARSAELAARICDDIRRAFADQEVHRGDYDHLVPRCLARIPTTTRMRQRLSPGRWQRL